MAKLSLRQAAAAFEVSRPTISKALTAGKISGERDPATGAWRVDPAELARVYRPRLAPDGAAPPAPDAAELIELRAALDLERAKREAAETLAEERGRHLDDLRRLLGTDAPTEASQRRWWRFWR